MKKICIGFILLSFVLVSCKDKVKPVEPTTLEVYLQPEHNQAPYAINQIIESPLGYRYYYTDIKIVGTNVGNAGNMVNSSYYFDFAERGSFLTSGTGDIANFANLTFTIGVPADLNHADPSLQPSTSMLNVVNVGDMHWGWNPGYKFITIEGKVDTIPDGVDNFDHSFFFHLGTDFLFKSKSIDGINWEKIKDTKLKTTLKLKVAEILDSPSNSIDLRVNYASHSENNQMYYSLPIMNQFVEAIQK